LHFEVRQAFGGGDDERDHLSDWIGGRDFGDSLILRLALTSARSRGSSSHDCDRKVSCRLSRNFWRGAALSQKSEGGVPMDGLIYLIGLIVVIMAILSFFGLH
jgi:hypothetical protein